MAEETVWPAEASWISGGDLGHACGLMLLVSNAWIHRRVETIDLLSTELARRQISVDFTVPEMFVEPLTLPNGRFLAPLGTLAKAPLRNFDLRDEGGKALPLVGAAQNSAVATSALLGAVNDALTDAGLGPASQRLTADLTRIAAAPADEAAAALNCLLGAAEGGDAEAIAVFDDPLAETLLSLLSANFVLLAMLDHLDQRRILKYGYDEPLSDQRPFILRLQQGLGLVPLSFEVDAPAASASLSYHAEIVIPEELRLSWAVLVDADTGRALGPGDADADRGAIHASDVSLLAQPQLLIALGAERPGFLTVAVCVSVVTSAALWVGAVVLPPDPNSAGPSITILLAVSALFAGAVVRSGEHRLVSALFAPARFMLAVVALAGLASAAVLALKAPAHTIDTFWTWSAIITAVLAVLLVVAWWSARGRRVHPPDSD
jgi:hypothetical protein